MKIDDAPLIRYLVKHLQPLTEADPTLLANYVVALLKNNKPKKDLQKLCIDQLFDFLGEGTKRFVGELFHALEDGTLSAFQEEHDTKESIDANKLAPTVGTTGTLSGDNTTLGPSPQPENIGDVNSGVFSDQEEEGSDDDRNHKHRRRVSRSRSPDRDTPNEGESGPYRKRSRPAENGQLLTEDDRSLSELRRRSGLVHTERGGPSKNERRSSRDHGYNATSRLNGEGNQRGGSRGAPTFRGDGSGSRFEHQNGLSRGLLGRGRGATAGLWGPHEQRGAAFDGSDFNAAMLPPGPPAALYSGRAIPSRGNPPHSPWAGYGHHPGMTNGGLDQSLPLNAGMQGPRGVPISAALGVGVNIGIGMPLARPRCLDFEERGYCLRGDLCPMEHGANRIVVEDVQSLSQFNLPVALPSGRSMSVGSVPISGPSTAPFSSNLAPPSRAVRETGLPNLDEPGLPKRSLTAVGTEPDLYDPDQPLWNKEQPDVAEGMNRLPSFRKGQEENEWEGGASERGRGQTPDSCNPEMYGRSTSSGGPDGMVAGASVWDRIGPVDRGESKAECIDRLTKNPVDGLPRLKVPKKELMEDCDSEGGKEKTVRFLNLNAGKGRGASTSQAAESALAAVDKSSHSSRGGGARSVVSGAERAQRTLYVSCIPNNNNKKELLMAHFQKFGDVMDIRIPSHSDRAFVQFCQRESAEAALKSPDAVMGNRFIRLSWANRDSIQDPPSEVNMPLPSNGRSMGTGSVAGHVMLNQNSILRGKDKTAVSATSEFSASEGAGKSVVSQDQSSIVAVSLKKQEELEHMKEEIRRKQEELAQKRDDFRRKLDRLSKQGSGIKVELESDQPNKRTKLDVSEGAVNGSCKLNSLDDSAVEKSTSPVDHPSTSSKKLNQDTSKLLLGLTQTTSGSMSQPSPRSLRSPFPRLNVAGTGSPPPWGLSRYKLDNRTTIFRVFPPFPNGLMDITALKEHFSTFGELLNLELEGADQVAEGSLTGKCVVRVTFGSRRAAEQAFVQGRWFQGTSLQVVWLNPSSHTQGVTPIGSKQGDGAKDNAPSGNNPMSSSEAIDKEGSGDQKSPRSQETLVTENVSGEDVQLAGKVADQSFHHQDQLPAYHLQSDVSTKLDGADVDNLNIEKGWASV